jgi:hypothetical protein
VDDFKQEQLRRAIAMATAAQTAKDGTDEAVQVLLRHYMDEDPHFEANIGIALLNLTTILLAKLEKATEQPATEILEDIARRYTL